MKTLLSITWLLLLISCDVNKDSFKSSIVSKFGAPVMINENKDNCMLIYEPKDDSYFKIAKDLKGHIDKTLNMLPVEVNENQNLEFALYDIYKWETPYLKVTLTNTVFDIKTAKYRNRVAIENK